MVGFVVVVDGDACLSAGVCGEDGIAVVVGRFEVQNNDREKRLSEDRSPYKSHIFPLYNGMG